MITVECNDSFQITEDQARFLLSALRNLIENGPIDDEFGICFNLTESCIGFVTRNQVYMLVAVIASKWEHTVEPGVHSFNPVRETSHMWKLFGLFLRISLMQYIHERLKDALTEAEKNGSATIN